MRQIKGESSPSLEAYLDGRSVEKADSYQVSSYRELMAEVAQLAFANKDYMLFFRGQRDNYENRAGSSTFYPSIYRGDPLPQAEVSYRFDVLQQASKALVDVVEASKINGHKEIRRKKYIRWSILQHYEVCSTPLLDFTHSVRVACSFAQHSNQSDYGYVFVFGLPYITNRISKNSEHDLVNVRLLSICPPDALRPYYQDGYVAGTEDVTTDYESKTELDFKNRLVAKFRFPNSDSFWGPGFTKIPEGSLYPKNDTFEDLCRSLKNTMDESLQASGTGEFLHLWAELEQKLSDSAGRLESRKVSPRSAIAILLNNQMLSKELAGNIDRIRLFRNALMHYPGKVDQPQIDESVWQLRDALQRFGPAE